jgi:hypothetical protein
MLLHQVIVVVTSWGRRFDAVVLHAVGAVRRAIFREVIDGTDLQET